MKTRKEKNQSWSFPGKVFITFLVFILILFVQYAYVALFPSVYGINMEKFASNRYTVSSILRAKRGNLFDSEGNLLALNVSSYTVIAYLSESRTGSSKIPLHVVDKQATAEALSPLINMSVETILGLLNRNAYQVELGPGGRGITELKKEEIEDLNLPGIDFIEDQKRYYPNGDFASYILGYAKKQEDGTILGELGIESKYESILKGTDGSTQYQQDRYGYKIPDTPETTIEPIDGSDIYLTIDSGVQRFLESAMKENNKKYSPEWAVLTVMDAKTGKILGSSTTPSYDPNILNITNYENPLVTYAYEPGSTMKIYSYMCVMENSNYNGELTYKSGHIDIGEESIQDWNGKGWGHITYDLGFEYSSNVAIVELVQQNINKQILKECYQKYGFGQLTGVELSREQSGSLKFNYPIEVATASFGQGIATTPIQNLQALTIIANNGKMVKPKIIEKIVDSKTGEITYEYSLDMSEQIVSVETINKIKELMNNVVTGENEGTTGRLYNIEGLDIIGKTGTSQYYDIEGGGYSTGKNNYIYSFAGMFPKDNPEIIIYGSVKNPSWNTSVGLANMVTTVSKDIAKYLNINMETNKDDLTKEYIVESFINNDVDDVVKKLQDYGIKTTIIGEGNKVIRQSAMVNSTLLSGDRVVLITNDKNITMPSVRGWSRREIIILCDLLNIKYEFEGYGYAISQSIAAGEVINKDTVLTTILESKLEE
ncbi:MAG: penicillin-binding protein [Firmicutes bacterium]|nr:penicillin-binding protein [Bacillota bacterium]